MRKAVLYARVSGEIQKKEHTVESQVAELKKQIASAGDILVKEYVEEGYTGINLDRPALNELRSDLKKGVYDSIYVWSTDRISRSAMKFDILLTEILLYKKHIIISGEDYISNPENKFKMTVLAAVAELERAKILERNNRGRQYHLKQGHIMSHGNKIFGYTYFRRTSESFARYEVNEHEAKIIRLIFETYAQGNRSIESISKQLIDTGFTKERVKLKAHRINYILRNESYTGTKYFNTMTDECALGLVEYHNKGRKAVLNDRSKWIGIKIPAIISKELFNKVQSQLKYNREVYRNARGTQSLSNLVICGKCKRRCYACRKAYSVMRTGGLKFYQKSTYRCTAQVRGKNHNPEIDTGVLEFLIKGIIRDNWFDTAKVKGALAFLKKKTNDSQSMEKQLKDLKQKASSIAEQKSRIVDLYSQGGLPPADYFKRTTAYEERLSELETRRTELLKRQPVLNQTELVRANIIKFCAEVKARFENCKDFNSWRQFFLNFVDKVEYTKNSKTDDRIQLYGSVPIAQESYTPKLEFKFERKISEPEIKQLIKEMGFSLGGKPVSEEEFVQKKIKTMITV